MSDELFFDTLEIQTEYLNARSIMAELVSNWDELTSDQRAELVINYLMNNAT